MVGKCLFYLFEQSKTLKTFCFNVNHGHFFSKNDISVILVLYHNKKNDTLTLVVSSKSF